MKLKKDNLLKKGHWPYNACLSFTHDPTSLYIRGYKQAANLLVEWVEKKTKDQDFLVYPIIFLYRQHVELRLKEIIKEGSELLETDSQSQKNTHHKIDQLWNEARKIIDKIEPQSNEDCDIVEDVIRQFSKIDSTSTAFRYPKNKQGSPSTSIKYINLKEFSNVINSTTLFLEAVSYKIDYLLDNQSDFFNPI